MAGEKLTHELAASARAGNDELLNTQQASQLIAVSPGTLRFWRHQRTGPPWFKLGKRMVRYRRSELVAWLDQQYRQGIA